MIERRHPNVINVDEAETYAIDKGKHQATGRVLGTGAGSAALGGTVMELPPGARAWPFHFHTNNEEAVYVIAGSGTVRIGDARVPIRAGDWIAHPVGPAYAHQVINDGDVPLVYLCVSTQLDCEVVGYPDSNKLAARGGSHAKPWLLEFTKLGTTLDLWDGEPDAT